MLSDFVPMYSIIESISAKFEPRKDKIVWMLSFAGFRGIKEIFEQSGLMQCPLLVIRGRQGYVQGMIRKRIALF